MSNLEYRIEVVQNPDVEKDFYGKFCYFGLSHTTLKHAELVFQHWKAKVQF